MNNSYETAYGSFILNRNSEENNLSLQAWSSADLYMLDKFKEYELSERSKILILNDSYGALTVALAESFHVFHLNDSYCSQKECLNNLKINKIKSDQVQFLHPFEDLPGDIDFVLLKIPKSLNYLEYQLQILSESLPENVEILSGEMSKSIHSSTVALFEHYINDVKTSLAWKKSRLVQGQSGGVKDKINVFPTEYTPLEESFKIINYPNSFAHGRLDPGTAFLMDNFPFVANNKKIVDLACGDGILAIKAAKSWPESEILCVDESWLAIESAKESFKAGNFPNSVEYKVTDVLEGVEENWADLILCNPPFHNNNSLTTSTAIKMFRESAKVLKKGGELFVVANRHLGYEKPLSRIFSKAQVIKSNKKFSILRAIR